jgi:hypothetical protein
MTWVCRKVGSNVTGARYGVEMHRVLKRAVTRMLPEPVVDAIVILKGYKRQFGVLPNLVRPRTLNEKIVRRMLFDRRPILTQLADKYAVREYVKTKVGAHVLPRLYWVTKAPDDIPFGDLPSQFVVKPTHGSGWVHIVYDKALLDQRELIDTCRRWLSQNYYYCDRERVYKNIEPRILVEELINDGTGPAPIRYKVLVFGGRAHVIMVISGTPDDLRCGLYGRSWEDTGVTYAGTKRTDEPLPRPPHLTEMLRYAEILGGGLDFVRVDLYDTPDKVYFGEITTTPLGGRMPFDSREFDRQLGDLWDTRRNPLS